MKTTIDVSDALFNSAKALAQQNQTTLRALVEEGLRRVLADSQARAKPAFKLSNASVHKEAALAVAHLQKTTATDGLPNTVSLADGVALNDVWEALAFFPVERPAIQS